MKILRLFGHPYTLIVCFCFILISGEHWGGFYVVYILMALPFGRLQSILALVGIIVLIFSYINPYLSIGRITAQLLNILGVLSLLCSLVIFFKRDTAHYNWGTFYQAIPLFTLSFTAFVALCFLVNTFLTQSKKRPSKMPPLSKAQAR